MYPALAESATDFEGKLDILKIKKSKGSDKSERQSAKLLLGGSHTLVRTKPWLLVKSPKISSVLGDANASIEGNPLYQRCKRTGGYHPRDSLKFPIIKCGIMNICAINLH